MKERVVVEEEEEDDDPLELFSSSLATLFSIFTPSLGSPSSLFTYTPPASSSSSSSRLQSITVRIPPQIKNELFTHYQWMSGIKLADRIVLGEIEVRGKKVLELGAGTGLPGLMAGKLGANEVVLSDYNDPSLILNIDSNILSTFPTTQSAPDIKAWGFTWGESIPIKYKNTFDSILLADTIWSSSFHIPLLSSLVSLLKKDKSARIEIISGLHSGRFTIESFLSKAFESGFEKDGEWFELNCDTTQDENDVTDIKRKWGWLAEEGKEEESIEERGKWVVSGTLKWKESELV